jgi:sorting nexin-29
LEEKIEKSDSKIESLTKENDILKLQVKKYLSAIQMLNNSESGNRLSPTGKDADLVPSYVLYQEAQEYEKKLIQVAEMHGELVEFNDRLHRVILQKESIIKRLREELIELRGPLPEGVEVGESDDISSVASTTSTSSTLPSNIHRPLVNIWIPTAFLAGQQRSSSHHVYQVYIRIKDEEWNVYRRYSQFYEMHCKLRKKYPIVDTFDFPPKKTFSKRDARVVQERRKRLESYLRSVVNVIQVEHEVTDRRSLTVHLSFLGLG